MSFTCSEKRSLPGRGQFAAARAWREAPIAFILLLISIPALTGWLRVA